VDDLAHKVKKVHLEWHKKEFNVKHRISTFDQIGLIDPFNVEESIEKAFEKIQGYEIEDY